MELDSTNVSLNLGVIKLTGNLKKEKEVTDASWDIYVELVTRVILNDFEENFGSIREAMTSYYDFFKKSREILEKYGPKLAKQETKDEISLAMIVISILNFSLRPFLSKWHPLLLDYESSRKISDSIITHEKNWSDYKTFLEDMKKLREHLKMYADLLCEILEIKKLHEFPQNEIKS